MLATVSIGARKFVGRPYAMCEGRRKGTGTEELDIIARPVIGQLLPFLFRHDGLEI